MDELLRTISRVASAPEDVFPDIFRCRSFSTAPYRTYERMVEAPAPPSTAFCQLDMKSSARRVLTTDANVRYDDDTFISTSVTTILSCWSPSSR